MFASTKRLNLRAFQESDGERMVALQFDRRVQKTSNPDYVAPKSEAQTLKVNVDWVHDILALFVVEVKPGEAGTKEDASEEERWVGFVSLRQIAKKNREVLTGIALRPEWWDKGFGTEAMRWTIEYAFEQLGMHRVALGVVSNHERAITAYKRLGFAEEVRKRKAIWQDGKWLDGVFMAIVEDEWYESKERKESEASNA